MELNDILALAKAGFNSQQIVALAGIGQKDNATPTPQVSQPTQQMGVSQPIVAQPMGLMPQPQTVTTAPTAPVSPTTYQDPILAKLTELTSAVQANAIIGTGMPSSQPETPEDILAQIINPPSMVDQLKGGNK